MERKSLSPPKEFKFPFEPYPIQHDFMTNLYNVLEQGKLGIFESPTGTGKSLSIICGALQWLLDHEQINKQNLLNNIDLLTKEKLSISEDNDWLKSQSKEIEIARQLNKLQTELNVIKKHEEKIEKIKSKKQTKRNSVKKRTQDNVEVKKEDLSLELNDENKIKSDIEDLDILLEDVPEETSNESDQSDTENDENKYEGTKIYFCSRTHSQLAQFVGEVLRSPFGNEIRLITLASRQSYCINDAVKKLKNISLINERCIDLQQNKKGKSTLKSAEGRTVKKTKISSGCPYMLQNNIEQLKEEALTQVQDVEQLVTVGKQLKGCPYYSARASLPDSQIIIVPYNLLLHKSTRIASGIELKNNIVIIDEAHNLLDIIGHIHSSEVTGVQLTHAYSQLVQYRDKYSKLFTAYNLLNLNQIVFIVGQLIKVIGGKPGCNPKETIQKVIDTKLYSLQDFLLDAGFDNINLFNILQFCQNSKITHKLHGFTERYQPSVSINPVKKTTETGIRAFLKEISKNEPDTSKEIPEENKSEVLSNNPLLAIIGFLESLTNACEDGRIVCKRLSTVGKGSLKFLLLNPASQFTDIVKQARAVIVAGGTMQPVSEFRDQLFLSAGGDENRILEFSCDHVIPKENILPIILNSGPSGKLFDFSYDQRNDKTMLNELGRLLINICNVIPAGIVCFFPSYEYEKLVYEHLNKTGTISKLELKKQIFREPKSSGEVDNVLEQYSNVIKKCKSGNKTQNGALMFSVVGGKLSEGLNFSDDLGRCVIVVGLPYPNIKSPELQEKIKYLNEHVNSKAGNVHYENLCMKAVNQCIGRAVRHKNDYSSVLLIDHRFNRPHIQKALPSWIQRSLVVHDKFGPAMGMLAKFFFIKKMKPA